MSEAGSTRRSRTAKKKAGHPRPSWVPEELFPFESRFVDVNGCSVHHVDEGKGPVLLMLHGNPTWSFLYRNVILGLRDKYRCIALDYPGFGLSQARPGYRYLPVEHSAVVEGFVNELGLTGITLMVQDWGGPIGLGAAGRDPKRYAGFVIGNTFAWPMKDAKNIRRFAKVMGGGVGKFLIRRFNVFVNVFIPGGVKTRKLPRTVMDAYRGPFVDPASRTPVEVFPRELLASRDFLDEVERGLERLNHLPTLIVWGDRDVAFRKRELSHFQRSFGNHETVMLEGAGHYIQEDVPEEIVAAIRAWAARRGGKKATAKKATAKKATAKKATGRLGA